MSPLRSSLCSAAGPFRRALPVSVVAAALSMPASAETLDPGNFRPFVEANRLDAEIAHVLNILDHYPDDSWAKQTASFAHHELLVGNLLAMVKASNFAKVTPSLPPVSLLTEAPRLAMNAGLRSQTLDAVTVSDVGAPSVFLGYVLIKDSVVTLGTPPGKPRKRLAGVLAHELTHFRNRVYFNKTLPESTRDLRDYVDPGDAAALANAGEFMQELVTNHVEWRVLKDIEHKWEGGAVPARARPRGLYSYGIALGMHLVPERNVYLSRLVTTDPASYNRQIGLWLRLAGANGLFHDDPTVTSAVSRQFQDDFELVQPGFATPVEAPDGGVVEWEF